MSSKLKWRFFHPSLRLRLTTLFSLILGLALTLFSFLLYQSFIESHQEDFDIALYNHAVDVADGIDLKVVMARLREARRAAARQAKPKEPSEIPQDEDEDRDKEQDPQQLRTGLADVKIFPFALSRTFMQIRASRDRLILAASGPVKPFDLPFSARDARLLSQGRDSTVSTIHIDAFLKAPASEQILEDVHFAEAEDEMFRLVNFPIDDSPNPQLILQIAVPLTFYEMQHESLRHFFYVSIPAALLLAAFGGFFLAGRALKPVSEMIRGASQIGIGDLSERLPVPPQRDELHKLALTLNSLLARVEKAFRSQERFIADASHQLLTPLAILRGEIDVMSKKDPDDIKLFLESASQEVNRLSRTVRDMLLLARADAGVESLALSSIRLDEMVLEATERVDRYASMRRVRLRLNISGAERDDAFDVKGDRDLLLALFQNLLENAVKYSPEEGLVDVSLQSLAETLIVRISDRGPGISASEIPNLFERFYRSPETSQRTDGVGLGLAIAQKISDVHGAKLSVESRVGEGTTFSLEIKRLA